MCDKKGTSPHPVSKCGTKDSHFSYSSDNPYPVWLVLIFKNSHYSDDNTTVFANVPAGLSSTMIPSFLEGYSVQCLLNTGAS